MEGHPQIPQAGVAREALEILDHRGDLVAAGAFHERRDLGLGWIHLLVHERGHALSERLDLFR